MRTSSSLSNEGDIIERKELGNNQHRPVRHASAHRLFEVNEWEEQQKRLKQKIRAVSLE